MSPATFPQPAGEKTAGMTQFAAGAVQLMAGAPFTTITVQPTAGVPLRDPAFVPLPSTCDDDICTPHVIAQSQGRVPSPKVAGTCHPGRNGLAAVKNKGSKGKDKENDLGTKSKKHSRNIIDLDDDDLLKAKRGCPQGAGNYSTSDTNTLLDCVEEELPLGQRGWLAVTTKFNKWASKNSHPEWKVSSLETKFKQVRLAINVIFASYSIPQLVKMLKPTGTGVCPPKISRAHEIDELINERAGTRNLDDSKYDEAVNKSDGSTDEELPSRLTAIAHSQHMEAPPPVHCNTQGAAATELMSRLSNALDPEAQKACDDEWANRAFATTQYLTLSQQLRDAQATNDKLHGQLFDLRNQLYEAHRDRDCLEMRLEMLKMSQSGGSKVQGVYHHLPKEKRQCYKWFADGGRSLTWLMDDEDDDDFGKPADGFYGNTEDHTKTDSTRYEHTPEVE